MENISDYLSKFGDISPFAYDIDFETARRSYYNISHNPERAAAFSIACYCGALENLNQNLEKKIARASKLGVTVESDWQAVLADEVSSARKALSSSYSDYLNSLSLCASSFITGGSNFPVERQRKRRQWADNKRSAFDELLKKIERSIATRLLPDGDGTQIRSDSARAIELMEKKIEDLQFEQDRMKAINRLVRSELTRVNDKAKLTDDEKESIVTQLMFKFGLTHKYALDLLTPNYGGKIIPFESFQLSNNNANIKRYTARLKEQYSIEESRNDESSSLKNTFDNGVETGITDDNKLYISFPIERISKEDYSRLRAASFKYSRYRCMFVRKHTANAEAAFKRELKFLADWSE